MKLKDLSLILGAILCTVQFGLAREVVRGDISPNIYSKIAEKNRLTTDVVTKMAPNIYPAYKNTGPVACGNEFEIPHELGNRRLAELGYVDVTAAPFKADPTGKSDSTKALQNAVNFARDNQLAVYFPLGTYAISDTLECIQYNMLRASYSLQSAFDFPCALIGSSQTPGERPTIYLLPNSPGFGDSDNRKIIVHLPKASKDKGFGNHDAGENYNQTFRNINITIGQGNSGAIGIRMQAAEGSSIQDVTIDATHGHTGMQGLAGSGGSHHNITIIGGRVGIDTRGFPPEFKTDGYGTQPSPTLSQVTLIGQTEAALIHISRGPLTIVGMKVIASNEGPVLVNYANKNPSFGFIDSSLCVIDSVIEFSTPSPRNTIISAERSFYFENLFVKNAVNIDGHHPVGKTASGWIRYVQCAINNYPITGGLQIDENPNINGKKDSREYVRSSEDGAYEGFVSRHRYGIAPSWENKGACVVKAAPYNAVGDGVADDTEALQKAIDENETVFLPKGYYRVTDTIRLRPNTKLIGVTHQLSVILAKDPFGHLADKNNPKPIVQTADDQNARTYVAFIGIFTSMHARSNSQKSDTVDYYALNWRCGANSVLRSPGIRRVNMFNKMPKDFVELTYSNPLVQITGHGGGKIYNFYCHNSFKELDSYRHILVLNTTEPLFFYQLHLQHSKSPSMLLAIKASSFTTYGMKSENNTKFIIARDCGIVHLHGHGGIATPPEGSAEYDFENVDDLLFSNMADQLNLKASTKVAKGHLRNNARTYSELFDIYDGKKFGLEPLERPILYHRIVAHK